MKPETPNLNHQTPNWTKLRRPSPHPQCLKPFAFTYLNPTTDFHPRKKLTSIQGFVLALSLGLLIWIALFWLVNQL